MAAFLAALLPLRKESKRNIIKKKKFFKNIKPFALLLAL
jgi:hypothetical protein